MTMINWIKYKNHDNNVYLGTIGDFKYFVYANLRNEYCIIFQKAVNGDAYTINKNFLTLESAQDWCMKHLIQQVFE